MAKRSCRRTTDENLIHKKAVEMRKKTEEQLMNSLCIMWKIVWKKHEAKALIVEKPVLPKNRREQRSLSHSFS